MKAIPKTLFFVLLAAEIVTPLNPVMAAAYTLGTPDPGPEVPGLPRPSEHFPGSGMWTTGNTRTNEHKTWDTDQHPIGVLVVFGGLEPKQTFLELLPAGSYWSEFIGGLLTNGGAKGRYIQAADSQNKKLWDQLKIEDDYLRSNYNIKIELTALNLDSLAPASSVDMVLMSKKIGQLIQEARFEKVLGAAYKSLKPGGSLIVEDYRANTDKPQDMKAANLYIREDYAVSAIEKAGFKLAKKDDALLANAKDAKAKAAPNSDRFLLKFTK